MERVLVGFGSNLGDREANLRSGLLMIRQHPLIALTDASAIYETDPVGGPPQARFLNACAIFLTVLSPAELFGHLRQVERVLGRTRSIINGPRTLDLDVLLFGDTVVDDPDLTIPHPRLHERGFVLKPACDVAASLVHPSLGRTLADLLEILGPLPSVRFFRPCGAWAAREMPHDHC